MTSVFQNKTRSSSKLIDRFAYHVDNVTLSFGELVALHNITLTVNPGDMLFVTGKSGSGKTSLLNLLAGSISPSSGKVYGSTGEDDFTARVFQDLKLIDGLSVEENLRVAYDRRLYKSKNEFNSDMNELVSILGMQNRLALPIQHANGGLKHKTALVRALLSRPNILLADEPTASLDKENAHKVFDILNFYNLKRNLTVIWASHNKELIKNFPGKMVHLENGKLVYSGHACFI